MIRKFLVSAVLLAGSTAAVADPVLTFGEDFNDISTLAASGWLQVNNSTPGGETAWFQGNSGVFEAESGSADAYIAANFLGAPSGGSIDNWLISPVFALHGLSTISFSTRTANGDLGDNLELLFSLGSTDLADFKDLGTIISSTYPTDWTTYSLTNDLAYADIRFAFRYLVKDTSVSGDYIGIDSFKVTAVPEPGALALFGIALLLLPLAKRRRREQV